MRLTHVLPKAALTLAFSLAFGLGTASAVLFFLTSCSSIPPATTTFTGQYANCLSFQRNSETLRIYQNQCDTSFTLLVCRGTPRGIRQCFADNVQPNQKSVYVKNPAYQLDTCDLGQFSIEKMTQSYFIPTWAFCRNDATASKKVAEANAAWYNRAAAVAPYVGAVASAKITSDQTAASMKTMGVKMDQQKQFKENLAFEMDMQNKKSQCSATSDEDASVQKAHDRLTEHPTNSNRISCTLACTQRFGGIINRCGPAYSGGQKPGDPFGYKYFSSNAKDAENECSRSCNSYYADMVRSGRNED